MVPWLRYILERLNPLVALPLIVGYSLSAVRIAKGVFDPLTLIVSCLALFYIAFFLRLKNDIQDFERDRIAFPSRPLPRGLISRYDAMEMVKYLEFGLTGFFGIIFIFYPPPVKLTILLTGGYIFLLAQGFFIPQWERSGPLLKGILAQILLIPLTLFIVGLWNSDATFTVPALSYTLIVFGASFVNGFCRKLDPFLHPASMSFIHYYGFRFSFYVGIGALLISALGAYGLGVQLWLWPCEIAVLYTLTMLFKKPKRFRFAQIAALLSLFVHIFSGLLI